MRFCRNSGARPSKFASCVSLSESQRIELRCRGRGVTFKAVHLPFPDHVHLYGRLPVMQVRFQCWLARYEVADLYPAFVAGVSGLLAPMEFAGLLLIRLADC